MGSKAADFVGYLGKVLLHHAQDVMRAQLPDSLGESDTYPPDG